jgi:hypothetical protein
MVERPGKDLSVRRQCALVGVARSGVYRPKPVKARALCFEPPQLAAS